MRVHRLILCIGVFVGAAAAHANPITYQIQGYLVTDRTITLTGTTTIEVNNTYPSVLSITLNFSNGTTQSGIGTLGQDHSHNVFVGVANDDLSFTDDLHNYTPAGGAFNLRDVSGDYVGSLSNGTVTPVSTAPEPTGLALLGTGFLGVIGVVRKRFA